MGEQDTNAIYEESVISEKPVMPSTVDINVESKPWYKVPHLIYLNCCIFVLTLTSTNNGYDASMLNGLQSLETWEKFLDYPTGQRLGAITNGVTFGAILGFFIASIICDRFGRRVALYTGSILTFIGSILQGVSTNYGFFLGARIIIGFGYSIGAVAAPTFISELAYPTHRETCTVSYNVCYFLGAVVAAWVTYGTRLITSDYSWRIPSYLQGVFPLIQILFFWIIPESPRYLVDKGKTEEAEKVLKKYHTGNSSDPRAIALIDFEINEIRTAIELEKLGQKSQYIDFIVKKTFRKRLFLVVFTSLMTILSGNGLISYYLTKVLISIGITEEKKQLQINGCLVLYNLVICVCVCSVARKFKRRTLFITCCTGMLIAFIVWTILSALNQENNFANKSLANGVLAMIFIFFLFYDIGINGLPWLYVTEILPYSHRAKGLNIFTFVSTVGSVYNGYVNTIAMEAIEWKYYIVYCCILVVELVVVVLFYPETSGYTLEEVAQVFGDNVVPPKIHNDLKSFEDSNESEKESINHVEVV